MDSELKRKKILVICCGGDNFKPHFGAREWQRFLRDFLELQMLAEVKGEFLWSGIGAEVTPELWLKMAKLIRQKYNQYDGFVVTHGVDNVLYSSNMLTYLLPNLTKPVVFTGATAASLRQLKKAKKDEVENIFYQYGGLGIHTNLLNAVQVATLAVSGVSLLYGTDLVRAVQAQFDFDSNDNVFKAGRQDSLGNVKFGINLLRGTTKIQPKKQLKGELAFSTKVKIIDFYPGQDYSRPDYTGYQGVIIKTFLEKKLPQSIKLPKDLPVLIYTQGDFKEKDNLIQAKGYTWEAAVTKFMWALGQSQKVGEIRKIMQTNLAGEISNA